MSAIYIEAFSGLSGNMFLSAFCELLDDYQSLIDLPKKLHLPDAKIEIKEVDKNGINCKYVEVLDLNLIDDPKESKAHDHEHSHDHGHSHHHSAHRHLSDIQKLIDHAHISEGAKKIAHEIFLLIGKAESKIHKMPLETIHFHEISGVDSIVDIVGNAVMIDKLKISKVFCTPVCTGFGMVKTQHGMLPIPAPATAELLHGMQIYPGNEEGEKVTPTGAAILRYLNPDFESTTYVAQKTAYGPGKKNFNNPNVVRISLIEENDSDSKDSYIQLETSIDDMTPEYLGTDFQQGLLDAGAVDFGMSQQLMKKGRFGFLLSVILPVGSLTKVSNYLFDNTTTIGLRYYSIDRIELPRKRHPKATPLGEIHVKEVRTPTDTIKVKPEYDDIKNLAATNGQTPFQVLNKININPLNS
ncbi:nickel pincer cofactor biosynthesis protein LarC [Ulvibacterium marinum]|uniref:Putative nickel insertion protein n=1 Tax=Ulvibacterium marinum TaxID=2419782 RepID=A0A3B0CA42_9FLAO|nr:nickel pincer cofactor biosynthesis protein LarC [Ulvibacterium marinum]RKN83325.1 nickel pincer cofactor biosynthesis protein LarC [Ulvibacterium marinum]